MYEYDYDERTNFEKDLDAEYEAERMFEPRPWLVVCEDCRGTGDGGGIYDEELHRWHSWVCGKCHGTGQMSDPDFDWVVWAEQEGRRHNLI